MTITIKRQLYAEAPDERTTDCRSQTYVEGSGLRRMERRSLQRESDWSSAASERFSDDNGRTWGEWRDVCVGERETRGEDEINMYFGTEAYNPRYKHFVSVGMQRIFFGGHHKAYQGMWARGEAAFADHCLMVIRADGSADHTIDLVKYEEGADYNPAKWRDPAYIDHNRAYMGNAVHVLSNGEIIFPIAAAIRSCCRIRGLDIEEIFPSCPDIMSGMIVARGRLNEGRGRYDLSFSRPVVISDLKSSRGVCEPEAAMLPSGRIIAVFRGANTESENWNTRIEPGTPAHKWFCYSDDDGKTFTDPVPWHFDDREVFYSAATISAFVTRDKDDRLYWIGNISDHHASGNHPRHPLVIAEVNDRGLLVKNTLTTIDRREEGDSAALQLSNFCVLQDRETGLIELYLAKLGQREGHTWWADSYRYFINVDD